MVSSLSSKTTDGDPLLIEEVSAEDETVIGDNLKRPILAGRHYLYKLLGKNLFR